jgi:excisionase family DNA binding protein
MSRLLTVDEAAERLGTPPRFVRRLVAERRIPFSKIGEYVRFRAEDIDRFIDSGRVEPVRRAGNAT